MFQYFAKFDNLENDKTLMHILKNFNFKEYLDKTTKFFNAFLKFIEIIELKVIENDSYESFFEMLILMLSHRLEFIKLYIKNKSIITVIFYKLIISIYLL